MNSPQGPSRVQRRFQHLLSQLETEYGYGWQTRLARELGGGTARQSYISALHRGEKFVGLKELEDWTAGLGISYEYFFGDYTGERSYKDFLEGGRGAAGAAVYPTLEELLSSPFGGSLSASVVERLLGVRHRDGDIGLGAWRALALQFEAEERGRPREGEPIQVEPRPGRVKIATAKPKK